MELDGFCDSLRLAFEHQGRQHYELSYFTQSPDSLKKRIRDDIIKLRLSRREKVRLIEVPEVGAALKLVDLEGFIRRALSEVAEDVTTNSLPVDYRPAYLANGSGEMLTRLKELAASKGGECVSRDYMGSRVHHDFRCAAGHSWGASPGTIFKGRWCPFCAAAKKASSCRLQIGELHSFASSKGGKLVSKTYRSQKEKQEWECSNGHRWFARFNNVKEGKWCPYCARWSLADMDKLAQGRGGRVLSKNYKAVTVDLEWECAKGHSWFAKPSSILKGTWCPRCANNRKLDIASMQNLANARGGLCISPVYVNARTKIEWQCAKGHRWLAAPHSVKAGSWCPYCSGIKH